VLRFSRDACAGYCVGAKRQRCRGGRCRGGGGKE